MSLPSIDFLNECFTLDSVTGKLYWNKRPLNHFATEAGWKRVNTKYAGKEAGCIKGMGYRYVNVNGEFYGNHRIVWKMTTGVDPLNVVHKNDIFFDNRFENLMEATKTQVQQHTKLRNVNHSTGFKGVRKVENSLKYNARITLNGVLINLGMFDTAEDAHEAYMNRAKSAFGEFANA